MMMSRSEEMMANVEKLLNSLNEVLGSPETKEALIGSMKNVQMMTANMEQMTRVMATLAVQNEAGLNQMLHNMQTMMDSMNKTVNQFESMMTIIANDGETARNIRDMLANMKVTSDRVANMAGALEGVVTDPETADNLKVTLKNARNMSQRADSMMAKLDKVKITAGAEVYGDADSGDIAGGFDLKIRTNETGFGVLGVTGIGIDTKTNAQLGYGSDKVAGRFGIMEDKLGIGYDQSLGSRTKLYLDVYDPNDVKVKLRGEYEFAPQLYLFGQGNMLNKSDERSAYFGLRKTF
jgi:phospholipid/cholesterol/gamma-HCH transport system substrate-binding protein